MQTIDFGNFTVKINLNTPIAYGSFGIIYKGITDTGETVAVKKFRTVVGYDPTGEEIEIPFIPPKETTIDLVPLTNPYIVKYLAFKKPQSQLDFCYLAMEWLSGKELEIKKLPDISVVNFFTQVYNGLSTLHKFGYIHRDLKPSNIYDINGNYKIIDLDSALPIKQKLGGGIGTPGYAPREQFRTHTTVQKSDFYALGVILYELLTGVDIFAGKKPTELEQCNLINRGLLDLNLINPKWQNIISSLLIEDYKVRSGKAKIESFLSQQPKPILSTTPANIKQIIANATDNLNLSYKNLTNFPIEILQLPNLKYLYLQDNRLTALPDNLQLNNLKCLYLYGNQLSSLPDNLQLPNLETLDLRNNPNFDVNCKAIDKLKEQGVNIYV